MSFSLTAEVVIPIEPNLPDDQVKEFLLANVGKYRDVLDLSGDYFDHKSQVDSWQVDKVEVDSETVVIHYHVDFSGFRPCQDLRYSQRQHRQCVGRRRDGAIAFQGIAKLEGRSTCDEL